MRDNLKGRLRKRCIEKRDSIDQPLREKKDEHIRSRLKLLKEFREAKAVLLFASFRTEPDTHLLIKDCLKQQKRVFLPRVNISKRELEIKEIDPSEELIKGHWGIPEPPDRAPSRDINEADLIIVPGLCFDRKGGRIGYGAGYYDKLLSNLKRPVPVVAIAYDEQIVETVPIETHDKRVDIIVTDREVIYCGHKKD